MKSGYKILWTDHALYEFTETIKYLEENGLKKNWRTFLKNLIIP